MERHGTFLLVQLIPQCWINIYSLAAEFDALCRLYWHDSSDTSISTLLAGSEHFCYCEQQGNSLHPLLCCRL